MELKDWVIILSPVIVNAIMIFAFQNRFLQLQKERDRLYSKLERQRRSVYRIRLETLKIYREYINRTLVSTKTFYDNRESRLTNEELNDNFLKLKQYIEELNFYYTLNKNIVPTNSDIDQIYVKLEEDLGHLSKSYTDQDITKILLDKFENILNDILSDTVSEIANMAITAQS